MVRWVFEEGTFIPQAKLEGDKSYSIITNHLGTPETAYDEKGKCVWVRQLDIYGKPEGNESGYLKSFGDPYFCNFLYQGQYHDRDIGDGSLVYNRFRYYDIVIGTYISQDPIGLAGKMPNMYSYVHDLNSFIDPFGLAFFGLPTGNNVVISFTESSSHYKLHTPDGSIFDLGKNADDSVHLVERPGKFNKIKADAVSKQIPVNKKRLKNFTKGLAEDIIDGYNALQTKKRKAYQKGVRDCFSFVVDVINNKLGGRVKKTGNNKVDFNNLCK